MKTFSLASFILFVLLFAGCSKQVSSTSLAPSDTLITPAVVGDSLLVMPDTSFNLSALFDSMRVAKAATPDSEYNDVAQSDVLFLTDTLGVSGLELKCKFFSMDDTNQINVFTNVCDSSDVKMLYPLDSVYGVEETDSAYKVEFKSHHFNRNDLAASSIIFPEEYRIQYGFSLDIYKNGDSVQVTAMVENFEEMCLQSETATSLLDEQIDSLDHAYLPYRDYVTAVNSACFFHSNVQAGFRIMLYARRIL